jgi:hypothetical protein
MDKLSEQLAFVPDGAASAGLVLALVLDGVASKTILAPTETRGTFVRSLFPGIRQLFCIALIPPASGLAIRPIESDGVGGEFQQRGHMMPQRRIM